MKKLLTALVFALPVAAHASTCELSIDSNDMMQYDKKELQVPAGCETVTLTLTHSGQLPIVPMGHNWVLTETANFQTVAQEGAAAGLDNNYVPQNDARVLASTKVIGGGEQTSVEFSVADLKGKDLTYFCSYPGHFGMMNGKLILN